MVGVDVVTPPLVMNDGGDSGDPGRQEEEDEE